MSKVSVLMPVYNCEAFLTEAVESVLRQTMTDFELIVVDDGSTDGSLAMLERFSDLDRRIRILRLPHAGIVNALNAGVRIARGKYIARLDADDISRGDHLAEQTLFMDTNGNHVLCGCDHIFFGSRLWYARFPRTDGECKSLLALYPCVPHSGAMLRTETLRRSGITYREEYRHAEDYRLWSELAAHGQFANLPKALVRYRIHPAQLGSQHSKEQHQIHSAIAENNLRIHQITGLETGDVHRFLWPLECDQMTLQSYWKEGRLFIERVWNVNRGLNSWLHRRMLTTFTKNLAGLVRLIGSAK